MANIGSFTKAADGSLNGFIRTLHLNTRAKFAPLSAGGNGGPDFRIFAGDVEIGAAWNKPSQQGRPFISAKMDEPSLPAPIYANLYEDDDTPGQFSMIWKRARTR